MLVAYGASLIAPSLNLSDFCTRPAVKSASLRKTKSQIFTNSAVSSCNHLIVCV